MSSSDHLSGSSVVVIAEVVGDDSTGSNEVIVLVEQEAGPWELPRTGLSVLKPGSWAGEGSSTTLLVAGPGLLAAALCPGDGILCLLRVDAGYSEYGQVDIIVIATSLLANRAAVDLSVSVCYRSVDNSDGDGALCGCLWVLQSGIDKPRSNEVFSAQRVSTLFIGRNAAALLSSKLSS